MAKAKGPNQKRGYRDQVKLVSGFHFDKFEEELNRYLADGWALADTTAVNGVIVSLVTKKLRVNVPD